MHKAILILSFACISFGMKSQCAPPSSFIAQGISTNSVDIDLSGSGLGPWELEYGLLGFSLGTGTSLLSANNTTSISNLLPNQSYRVYARRKCGSGSSSWVYLNVTTNCTSLLNAPVRFNFESSPWETSAFINDYGMMDSCWLVYPQGSNTYWSVGPPHETRLTTGPATDHTTGFGKYLLLNAQGISQDSGSTIKMPTVDLNSLNNPQLEFWYHLYGADIDSLKVLVKTATSNSWDTLHTFIGQQQLSQTDDWQSMTLSLDSFSNQAVNIQFVGYGIGTDVHMALDDISIHDSTSCQPATFFRHVSISDSSVLLDWDGGLSSSFKIEYGKKGFQVGTGTKLTISQPPFKINNLSPDTTYVFYLRSDCSSSQFSSWTGPLEVNTDCTPVYAPYFEDFEGGAWPNGGLQHCWDRYNYRDFKWNVGPPSLSWSQSGPGANNHTLGGSKFIVADRPNQKGMARSTITSPLIDLDSIVNPELVFWTHMFGLQISAFEISIDSGNGYNLIRKIVGTQQLSKTDSWTEQIIALPSYSGKKVKLKFTGIASSNYASLSRIAVDDISIDEAPSCRKPTNLQLTHINYTSAGINWLSGGSSNWMIHLKPTGGPSTIFPSSNNPLNLNQLQPGTEYSLWVRDSCGVGDVSEWSAPIVFKTYCLPDTTPYFENFESSQFMVQSSYFSTGTLASCWERSNEIGPVWQPSPASIFPNNLLPLSDHTTGSGKYIGGTLFLANGTNVPTSFTSPHIDLSNLVNPELSFWYCLGGYSFSSNQVRLEVNNGTGWQLLNTQYGPSQGSTSSPWAEVIVDLSNYADDTIRLRFKSIGDNLYSTTAAGIDDISIHENPSCLSPSNFAAYNITGTGALLSWTTGGASNWVVKHQPVGGSFQYQNTAVNDSFALSGLMPNTRYEIWVRDSCGADVSPWHGPLFITTECLPTQVPFYESFDGSLWTPITGFNDPGAINTCWRRQDNNNKTWVPNSGSSSSSLSGPSGTRSGIGNYMMLTILSLPGGTNASSVELSTPTIINSGLQQPELNYWYHLYGQQIQKLKVFVEEADDSRILIDSLIGQQQISQSDPWQQRSISLSAFQGDTIKIVFVGNIGNSLASVNAAIDDIEIVDAICSGPSSLSANNITFNSADLNWNSVSARSNIQYGLTGFSLGSGNLISGAFQGYSLLGLQAFTAYDYYVQDSCRTSNSSWVGPFSFTTSCTPPTAGFSHSGPSNTVGFNASISVGIALSYDWDFGDGNTGTGVNPSHTYASSGFYNVTLITTDTCGLKDTTVKNIEVCQTPLAVINHFQNGLSISFDGTSSTAAAQYYWNLGPAGVFTTDTFTTTFPAKGTYSIYLVVTNACGSRDTSFMNLLICDKPKASFKAVISTIIAPTMIVNFDGTASTYADSFSWDFGDGNTNTTSLIPVNVYNSTSLNYLVTLVVNANCGLSDTLSYRLSSISAEEIAELQMSVFPNPANTRVKLIATSKEISAANILWFDISGKQLNVPLVSASEGVLEFDVSALPPGEYFLVNNLAVERAIKITVY